MERFIAFCTGRPSSKNEECCTDRPVHKQDMDKLPASMPSSPAMVKKFFDCSFMACNNHTEDYNNWKKAMYAGKSFYFCSEACYNDWTEDPSQIGSWSPISEMSTESETTPLKI
tara:strand:+ start:1204 stop:1545 length:342 start_codon:yes stop_codon:yes gene_type:complete